MIARVAGQCLTDVDNILRTVFGDRARRESRKATAPLWLADRQTETSKTLLEFLRRWGACRKATASLNRLLIPSKWILDGRYVVFAVENQGVCRWAINLKSSRDDVVQQPAGSTQWYREPSGLLPFLVTFCFWNAVNGGLKHCVGAEEFASLSAIGREFTAVDSRLGRLDRSTRLYYADGAALICFKGQTGWLLNAGFRSRRLAAKFEQQFAPAS